MSRVGKVSVYGRAKTGKQIYGLQKSTPLTYANACPDICQPIPTLDAILKLVVATTYVVDQFFPKEKAMAPYVAKMGFRGAVPIPIFVRLAWKKQYPGVTYDNTRIQILQLKDVYLQYGFDWKTDPYLSRILPTS